MLNRQYQYVLVAIFFGGELFFIADLTHLSGTTSLAKVLAYLEAMEWKVNRLKRCRRHDHLPNGEGNPYQVES